MVESLSQLQDGLNHRIDELQTSVASLSHQFRTASPFPHIVIDDFLPAEMATALADTFPPPEADVWTRLPTDDQRGKLATADESTIPALQRYILFTLNSGGFLRFLEDLTGVEQPLIADTRLVGGGLHQILPGGKLAVHVDYSHHPQNQLFRRLNLLLYLNRDWKPEYGGDLELWDPGMKECQAKIAPLFNRAALFATSEDSYHGHPEPLSCPPGTTRKSLSLYYFSRDPPPGKETTVHNTLFRSRPGEPVHLSSALVRAASSGLFRDLTPPLAYRLLRRAWNRRFSGR